MDLGTCLITIAANNFLVLDLARDVIGIDVERLIKTKYSVTASPTPLYHAGDLGYVKYV